MLGDGHQPLLALICQGHRCRPCQSDPDHALKHFFSAQNIGYKPGWGRGSQSLPNAPRSARAPSGCKMDETGDAVPFPFKKIINFVNSLGYNKQRAAYLFSQEIAHWPANGPRQENLLAHFFYNGELPLYCAHPLCIAGYHRFFGFLRRHIKNNVMIVVKQAYVICRLSCFRIIHKSVCIN